MMKCYCHDCLYCQGRGTYDSKGWKDHINDPCFYCKRIIVLEHFYNCKIKPNPGWLQGVSDITDKLEGPIAWSHLRCYHKENPGYTYLGHPKGRQYDLMPSQLIEKNIKEQISKQQEDRDTILFREDLQFSEIAQQFDELNTKTKITNVIKGLPEGDSCIRTIKNFLEKYIEEQCPICYKRLISWPFDKSIISTSCGHIFHGSCLQDWIINNPTCPMCRSKIEPSSLKIITIDTKSLDDTSICALINQLTEFFTKKST